MGFALKERDKFRFSDSTRKRGERNLRLSSESKSWAGASRHERSVRHAPAHVAPSKTRPDARTITATPRNQWARPAEVSEVHSSPHVVSVDVRMKPGYPRYQRPCSRTDALVVSSMRPRVRARMPS